MGDTVYMFSKIYLKSFPLYLVKLCTDTGTVEKYKGTCCLEFLYDNLACDQYFLSSHLSLGMFK